MHPDNGRIVQSAIENSVNPILLGHVSPDADCIGSLLALAGVLRELGKNPTLILPEKTVSNKYRFMADLQPDIVLAERAEANDLIIVVDTAHLRRINLPEDFSRPDLPICNIDHHAGNEHFGKFNLVDTRAVSTSQIICQLIGAMGVKLNSEQATLLYAGMHCDSCGFSVGGVSRRSFEVAAVLAGAGARIGWVCQKLYRSMPVSEFKLMQTVYRNTQISGCSRFAWSSVTLEELDSVGASPKDIDEQVIVPRSIEKVKIAALFSEVKQNRIRVNLRANDTINLLPLAKLLGGGGHPQAAGTIMDGRMEQIIEMVKSAAIEYLDVNNGNAEGK